MRRSLKRFLGPAVVLALIAIFPPAADAQIPTPESVLGFTPGDDFELATYVSPAKR